MTGLLRRATLITAAGLLAATAAMAGVPSATTSTQPGNLFLRIMGQSAGAQDPNSNVTYTIRDASNNLVPGSAVIINFTNCTDIRLCNNNPQPTGTANCGAKTITGVTNAAGQVTFGIVGNSALSFLPAVGPGVSCATVTADGVPMSPLRVRVGDYDGNSGINALDIGGCKSDSDAAGGVPGAGRSRSDHDNNGSVNPLDIGVVKLWSDAQSSPASCTAGSLCP